MTSKRDMVSGSEMVIDEYIGWRQAADHMVGKVQDTPPGAEIKPPHDEAYEELMAGIKDVLGRVSLDTTIASRVHIGQVATTSHATRELVGVG